MTAPDPRWMSWLTLERKVRELPDRRVLWTRFDHTLSAEYDRRVLEAEAHRAA